MPITIRTPFKGLRYLIGGLFGFTALALAAGLLKGAVTVVPSVIASLLLGVASLLWFGLERVIVIKPAPRELTSHWSFFAIPVGKILRYDLSRADRVTIHKQPMKRAPFERRTFVQDFTYPVSVMCGDIVLAPITGWPGKKAQGRFEVDTTSLSNTAHFPSYSQWVAAQAAATLGITLEDGRSGARYAPDRIPREWFDPSRIRMDITMSLAS